MSVEVPASTTPTAEQNVEVQQEASTEESTVEAEVHEEQPQDNIEGGIESSGSAAADDTSYESVADEITRPQSSLQDGIATGGVIRQESQESLPSSVGTEYFDVLSSTEFQQGGTSGGGSVMKSQQRGATGEGSGTESHQGGANSGTESQQGGANSGTESQQGGANSGTESQQGGANSGTESQQGGANTYLGRSRQTWTGISNLSRCPVKHELPILMTLLGIAGIILLVSSLALDWKSLLCPNIHRYYLTAGIVTARLMFLGLFGAVLNSTYSMSPSFDPESRETYCDQEFYYFAYYTNFIIAGIVVLAFFIYTPTVNENTNDYERL
ncbi:hypothetical protein AVEN_266744-1 [Araneus ventricosus]|uniref:MARVEL domain-containing protein n=1 Tax=Araneus ventricosus TaxID=182803 RepID=A0A4Y2H0F9_ARAVE|nr:hypothetical protein AVEN_266744-1 [Araneus ventricosus]